MARGRRSRKDQSFIGVLLAAPWQVSVAVGVAVFVGLKWGVPALAIKNMFLKPVVLAASGSAWMFAAVFFLIGAIVFAKDKSQAGGRRVVEPTFGGPSVDRMGRKEPSGVSPTGRAVADAGFLRGMPGASVEDAGRLSGRGLSAEAAKPTEWSLELIRKLEWKRFEDVCQQFYEKKGIRSETTPLGPDGGIDIRLYQDDSGRASSIVQCKAWGERLVGVKPVRELLGVMTHEKIGKAFFMTSGAYTDEAKAVAQANRITLIDGAMLLMMIQRLPADARESLLAFATAGDFATPSCPSCGVKMKAVEGKGGRPDFWGCVNYPRCRQKLGMRRA